MRTGKAITLSSRAAPQVKTNRWTSGLACVATISLALALQACSNAPTLENSLANTDESDLFATNVSATLDEGQVETAASEDTYEAEASSNLRQGAIDKNLNGSSGGHVIGRIGRGNILEFANVSGDGNAHTIKLYFVNGDSKSRQANLSINGDPSQTVTFSAKGSWNQPVIQSLSLQVTLKTGTNRLRFENPQGWVANLDRIVIGASSAPNTGTVTTTAGTRDPWLWPFAQDSIWNTPIGSEAQYVPSGLTMAQQVIVDTNYLFKVPTGAPEQPVYQNPDWNDRCNGTLAQPRWVRNPRKTMAISDDMIVPISGGNNAAAFLMPDGKTLVQMNPLCRNQAGGPVYGELLNDLNIKGQGIEGGHGGSSMSSIGGTIRKGELINPGPIRHALKITLYAKDYIAYNDDGTRGYRWPALRADGYANSSTYGGKTPALEMGALLALKPNLTAEGLGLKTPIAKKMFKALQDYGAYLVDDSYCSCHNITAEQGVEDELKAKFGYGMRGGNGDFYDDVNRMWTAMSIVNNNGPDRKGGGGTPRVALAPAFE
jgi:Carbohydrate binding module (family 6)